LDIGTIRAPPDQYEIFLNGNYVSRWAAEVEVNHGGNLHAFNSTNGSWWIWNNGWLPCAVVHSWLHGERGVNDLVGFAFSSFSVLYDLLLGLLAVAAYQNFSAVSDIATREAAALTSLYLDTKGFPPAFRDELQSDLREYTRTVIEESWPLQRKGIVPRGGIVKVMKFRADLVSFEPSNSAAAQDFWTAG